MPLFDTDAVVLRTYDLKDADKIVVFLTRDFGVVRGVAKGAKKLKSRFGGGLQPISVVRLSFYRKEDRELVSVDSVELIKSNFDLAGDHNFQKIYSNFVSLINDFVPPDHRDERVYRLFLSVVDTFEFDGGSALAIDIYFKFWLLWVEGYLPIWRGCEICKVEEGNSNMTLQADFTLACEEHARLKGSHVSMGAIETYRECRRLSSNEFAKYVNSSRDGAKVLDEILDRLIARVLDREDYSVSNTV